jgi:hypothetical protein
MPKINLKKIDLNMTVTVHNGENEYYDKVYIITDSMFTCLNTPDIFNKIDGKGRNTNLWIEF